MAFPCRFYKKNNSLKVKRGCQHPKQKDKDPIDKVLQSNGLQ